MQLSDKDIASLVVTLPSDIELTEEGAVIDLDVRRKRMTRLLLTFETAEKIWPALIAMLTARLDR